MARNHPQLLNQPPPRTSNNKSRAKAMTSHQTHEESAAASQPAGTKNTIDYNRNKLNERMFSEASSYPENQYLKN